MTAVEVLRPVTRRPVRGRGARAQATSALGPLEQRRALVQRPGLVNRLRTARDVDVVAVIAPPGFGKTALVAEWEARDGRPFVSVAVGPDDDASLLGVRLLDAAHRTLDRSDTQPRRPPASAEHAVAELAAILDGGEPVVVVVDDVDRLGDPHAVRLLTRLATELSPGSQLALVGRAATALPIARWRASARLFELSTDELRLRDREALAVFRAQRVVVAGQKVVSLNGSLEGWPVGLDLAAQAIAAGRATIDDLLNEGVADALEYLRRELIVAMPEDERRFLTRASILSRLSPQLCDAVTGASESDRRLDDLSRRNHFVAAAAADRSWYVLHPAFRAALRRDLERREPQLVEQLHRRAAAWCADHHELELALDHACAARDIPRLAELVEDSTLPLAAGATRSSVSRWLAPLDDDAILEGRPRLAAVGALSLGLTGRSRSAARWLAAAERSPLPVSLRSLVAPSSAGELETAVGQALEALPSSSPWRPPLLVLLGCARGASGDAAADSRFEEAADAGAASGDGPVECLALAHRCLFATRTGRWGRADALAEATRQCFRDRRLEEHPTAVFAHAASARTALRHGDWETVHLDLERAHVLLPQMTDVLALFAVSVRLEIAQVHVALGDTRAAERLLGDIEAIYARQPDFGLFQSDTTILRLELGRVENGTSTLTAAELRLLPLLTTHLSFREIADRLFVSRNTVKTQAMSVYRKLGVSSRRDAIDRASGLGLVSGDADERCA